MKQRIEAGNNMLVRVNVCDLALAFYLCVLYAYQRENTIEMLLRYAALAVLIFVYMLVYGRSIGMRHERPLGTGYFVLWGTVLMLYSGLSIFWAMDTDRVLVILKEMLKSMLACFSILPRIRSGNSVCRIMNVILFALLFMIGRLLIYTPFSSWGSIRLGYEINQDANAVGRLANMGMLFSLYFLTSDSRHRVRYFFFILIFTVCALLTGSKSAILQMVVQVGLYFFLISGNWKRLLVVLGVIIGAGLMFYLVMTVDFLYNLMGKRLLRMLALFIDTGNDVDGSTIERLYLIRTAWEQFKLHPIFGVGMNNFKVYLEKIFYASPRFSHCGFLELLSTLGITGFIIYYSIYISTLVVLFKPARKRNHLAAVMFAYTACAFMFEISTSGMYNNFSYQPLMLAFAAGRVFRANQKKPRMRQRKAAA